MRSNKVAGWVDVVQIPGSVPAMTRRSSQDTTPAICAA